MNSNIDEEKTEQINKTICKPSFRKKLIDSFSDNKSTQFKSNASHIMSEIKPVDSDLTKSPISIKRKLDLSSCNSRPRSSSVTPSTPNNQSVYPNVIANKLSKMYPKIGQEVLHNFDTKSISNHLTFLTETIMFLLSSIENLDKENSSLKQCNIQMQSFLRERSLKEGDKGHLYQATIIENKELISSLEEQVNQTNLRIMELTEENEAQRLELEKEQSLHYDYKKYQEDSNAQNQEADEKINNLKIEIQSKTKDITVMRNKLKQINNDNQHIQSKFDELQKSNQNSVVQLQSEIKKNSAFAKENSNLKSDQNKQIQEINQLGERLNSIRSMNKEQEKTIATLQDSLMSDHLNQNSDESKFEKQKGHIDSLQSKINNLQKNEANLINANKKLKDENEKSTKTTHDLLIDKDRIIQALSIKIKEKELIIKKSESKCKDSKLNDVELQDYQKMKANFNTQKTDIQNLKKNNIDLKRTIEGQEREKLMKGRDNKNDTINDKETIRQLTLQNKNLIIEINKLKKVNESKNSVIKSPIKKDKFKINNTERNSSEDNLPNTKLERKFNTERQLPIQISENNIKIDNSDNKKVNNIVKLPSKPQSYKTNAVDKNDTQITQQTNPQDESKLTPTKEVSSGNIQDILDTERTHSINSEDDHSHFLNNFENNKKSNLKSTLQSDLNSEQTSENTKSFTVDPKDNTFKKDETFIFSLTERKFNDNDIDYAQDDILANLSNQMSNQKYDTKSEDNEPISVFMQDKFIDESLVSTNNQDYQENITRIEQSVITNKKNVTLKSLDFSKINSASQLPHSTNNRNASQNLQPVDDHKCMKNLQFSMDNSEIIENKDQKEGADSMSAAILREYNTLEEEGQLNNLNQEKENSINVDYDHAEMLDVVSVSDPFFHIASSGQRNHSIVKSSERSSNKNQVYDNLDTFKNHEIEVEKDIQAEIDHMYKIDDQVIPDKLNQTSKLTLTSTYNSIQNSQDFAGNIAEKQNDDHLWEETKKITSPTLKIDQNSEIKSTERQIQSTEEMNLRESDEHSIASDHKLNVIKSQENVQENNPHSENPSMKKVELAEMKIFDDLECQKAVNDPMMSRSKFSNSQLDCDEIYKDLGRADKLLEDSNLDIDAIDEEINQQ